MSGLAQWPALAGVWSLPESLIYERAVWGKVHGEASDFRWIAASCDPETAAPRLARKLNLGTEDLPESFSLWRSLDGLCCPVAAYPSHAVDATGRQGFLEKQVLLWRRANDLPAALGALALLPLAAGRGHRVWWDNQQGRPWSDERFMLPVPEGDHRPEVVNAAGLAAAAERGVEALRQAVGEQGLTALYAQVVAGIQPACLGGLDRPLPAEAVAALLLPLPRPLADQLSLAGWLPSSRFSFDDLAANWPVICLPARVAPPTNATAEGPAPARAWELAAALARALLHLDAPAAAALATAVQERGAGARQLGLPGTGPGAASAPGWAREASGGGALTVPELGDAEAGAAGPRPGAATVSLQDRATPVGGRWAGLRPMPHLDLAAPRHGATRLLWELHSFACATDWRWLAPERLGHRVEPLGKPDPAAGDLVADWIAVLAASRPPYADEDQWTVKLDLLRSAALALAPLPATLETCGLPEGRRVPALHLADLAKSRLDRLNGLGETGLTRVMEQSLGCRPNAATRRVRSLIETWKRQAGRRNPAVDRLIGEALARHPAPAATL